MALFELFEIAKAIRVTVVKSLFIHKFVVTRSVKPSKPSAGKLCQAYGFEYLLKYVSSLQGSLEPTDLESLWRHVTPRPNKGVGQRVDQLTGHAEITNLYLTSRIH
jgi:hypothetical protein